MLYELWAFQDSASPVPDCTLSNEARASINGASAVIEDPENFLTGPVTVGEGGLSSSYPPVYVHRNYLTVRVCKLDVRGDRDTLLVVPTVGKPVASRRATSLALYRYLAQRVES
jgi:hypothetical protein